ncbi:MAG: heavy metal-binding domain-containing protein [Vicinamibacterales bacterium]
MKVRLCAIVMAATLFAAGAAAQLPSLSWTCPMHPDVLDAREGACGICGMDLVPVRLVLVYTCPIHAVIEEEKPGKCRICARSLVQKTAALTFTCAGNREVSQLEPGTCADGSAMVPRYTPRAHGDHNPKHGGVFFMAPDNWHHLEGTYPAPGRFRVHVYDDFSKPLSAAQARKVRGRVITKEAFDPKTGTTRELASTPLVFARSGAFFEARIEPLPPPAKMTAKISFTSDDKESRFDFAFPAYSRNVPASTSRPNASTSTPAAQTATVDKPAIRPDSLLNDLKAQSVEVESLLKSGALGAIYVPALRAKDLALEIQATQPTANQEAIEPSVKQIVLAAYQLDSYGDLGDAEKAQEAFRNMSTAVARLNSIVSERR